MDELITEKTYTQKELEKIVEKRLLRERRNSDDFRKIKELVGLVRQNERFRDISNESLAKLIENALTGCGDAEENTAGTAEASENPESAVNAENAGISVQAEKLSPEESVGQPDNIYVAPEKAEIPEDGGNGGLSPENKKELIRFLDTYGEEKLKRLMNDSAFISFCKGKESGLCELYGAYTDFLSAVSQSEEAKRFRTAQSVLASTGYSQCASGGVDYSGMLTENQKNIAKASGMSYRQYAELLSQIPSKNGRNRFF